jgi:ubiquinone/menaquinone biosynthesis C-methylase UbiE
MANRRVKIPLPAIRPALGTVVNAVTQHFGKNHYASLKVLEAGCGVQSYTKRYISPLWTMPLTIHGIDTDDYALENKEVNKVYLGSVENMPLDSETYDIVMAFYLLEHVVDYKRTLSEMTRVLKPGGLMMLIFPNPYSPDALITRFTPHWFHVLFKSKIQKTKNARKHTFPTVFSFGSVDHVRAALLSNGCKDVQVVYLSETYYRFRHWSALGYLVLAYSKFLDLLNLNVLKSSVVLCAYK